MSKFPQTDALVIGDDSSDLEPNLHLAVKRIFSSYYHNRNAPNTKYRYLHKRNQNMNLDISSSFVHVFRYPFVVRKPPTTEKKLKSVKSVANSSVKLRDLMENMTDDEIIDEVIYFCIYVY